MKKSFVLVFVITGCVVLLSNCHGSKKTASAPIAKPAVSYAVNMKSIVAGHCSPCHIPEKGGNKKALDTYDALKANIGDIIHRIELNPTDKGFMPFKNAKLSDSTISMFKEWRDAGMPE